VDYIFIQGHFTAHIWKFFAGIMGMTYQQTSLIDYLLHWSGITGKNEAHKTIIQTLPIVICWNLWKNRCSAKYGGKKSSILRVKYLTLGVSQINSSPPHTLKFQGRSKSRLNLQTPFIK